jgi:hypothetical protein
VDRAHKERNEQKETFAKNNAFAVKTVGALQEKNILMCHPGNQTVDIHQGVAN